MGNHGTAPTFLALDLGAESGRAILGTLGPQGLRLEEVYRFPNGPVRVGGHLYWDVLRLWGEILEGIRLAARKAGSSLSGLGVDTWGVDFALLGADDSLLGNPFHYRDPHTDGMLEAAWELVPREEIYAQTGIQFMQINSLYQLLAMKRASSPLLEAAQAFLNIPDLFNFWLSGVKASEFTIASTTQCYNPSSRRWATELLERLGIPSNIFKEILPSGSVLGPALQNVQAETGCASVKVVATAGHDTASAVAAVPAEGEDYIYLSSGTWSLMGIESPQPMISARTLDYNLTNEGGIGGSIRLLKNIMGMWLLQECRREWARLGRSYSYDELTLLAADAPAFRSFVAPSDARFLAPGGMPGRIQSFCLETGQAVPQTPGEITRCILESLALEYRRVAGQLSDISGKALPVIHIIGGGSRNRMLNQFAANAACRKVIAGPVEATATGNILVQAIATGHLSSLAEGRALVRANVDQTVYEPQDTNVWDEAYTRYTNYL